MYPHIEGTYAIVFAFTTSIKHSGLECSSVVESLPGMQDSSPSNAKKKKRVVYICRLKARISQIAPEPSRC
jgi:hypothetical protein